MNLVSPSPSVVVSDRQIAEMVNLPETSYVKEGNYKRKRATLLAFYTTDCNNKLHTTGFFDRDNWPDAPQLLRAYHQVGQHKEDTIMDYSEDFKTHYPELEGHSGCVDFVYIPSDTSRPHSFYSGKQSELFNGRTLLQWVREQLEIEIVFENKMGEKARILGSGGQKAKRSGQCQEIDGSPLEPGARLTYKAIGGTFFYAAVGGGSQVIDLGQPTESGIIYIDDTGTRTTEGAIVANLRELAELQERRDWSDSRRWFMSTRTPPAIPHFDKDKLGYKRVSMLEDPKLKAVYDEILAFAKAQNPRKQREGWHKDGTQINFHSVETYMMHLPWNKKQLIIDAVKPMLEEWSGEKLEFTSLYGVREYRRGAVLQQHVDILETHVISTIINWDQKCDEPWYVELWGHDNQIREVNSRPGDLVFYESASVVHGRPKVCNCEFYWNAFLHFRPLGPSATHGYQDWKTSFEFTRNNELVVFGKKKSLLHGYY